MAKQRIPTYREEINAARGNLTDCGSIPRTFKMFLDFVLSKVNHKSKVVWHKQSTIAARLPCSVTTVERATRATVEVGAVIVICSSDRQARAEGVGVRSHHRYHNFLRPCLDWPGYNREPIPDEQRAAIKAIMAGQHGHGSGAKKTRERERLIDFSHLIRRAFKARRGRRPQNRRNKFLLPGGTDSLRSLQRSLQLKKPTNPCPKQAQVRGEPRTKAGADLVGTSVRERSSRTDK